MSRPHLWRCFIAALATLSSVRPATAQPPLAFIGVALDRETRQADSKLVEYLTRQAEVRFAPEDLEYERVVDRLVSWRREDGFFVARATPYVYVAAEMLGAELDVLATYTSAATSDTVYSSYFVVNRANFAAPPTLFEVERFLRERKSRPRFVYHNPFSTSSYFLPSLFFRAHKIFNMPESTESLVAISAERTADGSSAKLVEMVARGEADLAAVWDATRSRFERDEAYRQPGRNVYFVQLPTRLPNDLLIASASLDRATKDRLRSALRAMKPDQIDIADFQSWTVMSDATEARLALGDLRWLARERAYPVTVEIRMAEGAEGRADVRGLVEAARQAVRLSGTELVVFDRDFHEHIDVAWTLEPIHDGALVLRSAIPGSDVEDQVQRLSFHDVEDLSKRLVTIITSRMHRIRYVWPYSRTSPIVIRDMALWLPAGSVVKAQRITWLDPERNRFRAGSLFDARIKASGFYRYELDPADFNKAGENPLGFDAMSNTAYRVILVRPSEERTLFRVLTAVLLALLAVAAAGGVWDFVRARRIEAPRPVPDPWM